ncbi:fibrinogen-like protein 1 [Mercenaria mercenaria]|uniref:fibrinogen-like protein 1 n=1 Tax=Mercenaria mercenaria TaxID=6596 RepID=UPI00234F1092|nr:fibrinogen-like protein 1 [Mercenaria mercenaria]
MPISVCKRAVLIVLCIIGVYCSNSKRVIERIKHLESRFNTEAKFRDEDYAEVIDRLGEIDKRLNASLEQKVGIVNEAQGTDEDDYENVQHLREDFTRLRTAFREEKSETARIRREIPKIENNLILMKQDMDKYCMINLNKTEQLISWVAKADTFMKNDIAVQFNDINKEQKALRNEINDTSVLAREEFRIVAAQIEETVRNTVEKALKEITEEQIALRNEITEEQIALHKLSARLELLFVCNSCSDAKKYGNLRTGVYQRGNCPEIFCDQTTDGGGWTVFQRRENGEIDFYRNWKEYKNGFGDLNGEFWLGNERLSILTATGDHELRIDMEDFEGNRAFAKYSKFRIYPEEDKYKLEVSGYSGNAGDSLKPHNGMAFSTFDNDNEINSGNCAKTYHGAWWYKSCHTSNLNGKFIHTPSSCKSDATEINWYHWKKNYYCLKSVEMKFR